MIYIDENEGVAVIAQAYYKQNYKTGEHAKINKAQDLNTAAIWVLGRDLEDIPELLKSSVSSLRDAIKEEKITTIYFWYQHNCDEDKSIENELNSVTTTAKALLKSYHPNSRAKVISLEVGNKTLEKWYHNTTNKILVSDEIEIDLPFGGYEISGGNWSAYQAYISGEKLYDLYKTYKDELFSVNPRRFLGIGRKTNIINLGIKNSAQTKPQNFWVYNNGITALVNDYDCTDPKKLKISGMSIINGAQTTGTIGSLENSPAKNLFISLRIIKCSDQRTIEEIIANNNRQNDMLPSDFRSNDACQTRLREQFEKYPHLYYNGGQRNSFRPRAREVFNPDIVAQTLMAYNGDPVYAYSNRKEIWNNDTYYGKTFNEELTAEHIIFVYSLSKAIDDIKYELQQKLKDDRLMNEENNQLSFLCKRGSRILLLATISNCLEIILQQPITSIEKLHFDDNSNFESCKEWWLPVVRAVLPFHVNLVSALSAGGLNSKKKANDAMELVKSLVSSVAAVNDFASLEFKKHVRLE